MNLWRVKKVEPGHAVLDFSSSAQGRPGVTQLVAERELLANAVEFTSWTGDAVQVEVCSECGVERCAPRGWVSPRRSGDRLIWVPAFEQLAEDEVEFGPLDTSLAVESLSSSRRLQRRSSKRWASSSRTSAR